MNEALIRKIADRVVDGHDTEWGMDIEHFDWVPGVGLFGIWEAYVKTKDQKYLEFLKAWADRHLEEAYQQKTVNSTAPLLTVLLTYTETKNERYLNVCCDLADYVLNDAPRTVDGGLEHTVTEPVPGFSDQCWADTLFMVCIFLTKLGKITGEQKYVDFAVNQLKIHHRLLTDGKGLYFHGYNGAKKDHMSGIRWARANAWIIFSTMMILNDAGDFEGRSDIEKMVAAHVEALARVQQPDGGFCTILDDDTSYVEISATAGIIAGVKMAVGAGLADKRYMAVYEKGITAVENAVLEDGTVDMVSGGTPVMPDAQAYKDIPIIPALYGQGLAIAAL